MYKPLLPLPWIECLLCVLPSTVLQLPVHQHDAGPHQGVGRRSHELRGSRDELPHLECDRQSPDQDRAAPEVQMPRVSGPQHAVGLAHAHGRTVGVHHEVRRDLRNDAVENGRVSGGPRLV